MSAAVGRTAAIALTGLDGTVVHVEAAVSNQLPGMAIIGLPDAALAEAKQRVRLAIQQAGMALSDRFIVVNLSPAALPKQGSGFDLAIALSALTASKQLPAAGLAEVAHIGELSLGGELRRPPGLLSAVLSAHRHGFLRVMVPAQGRIRSSRFTCTSSRFTWCWLGVGMWVSKISRAIGINAGCATQVPSWPALTSRSLSARTRAIACSLAWASWAIGICAAMPPIACAPRR